MPDEGHEPAFEIERPFTVGAIVQQSDPESLVQIGRLAQALGDGIERELDGLEDLGIGLEEGCGALSVALRADLANRHRGHAPGVLLGPYVAVSGRLDAQPLRQGIYDADAPPASHVNAAIYLCVAGRHGGHCHVGHQLCRDRFR